MRHRYTIEYESGMNDVESLVQMKSALENVRKDPRIKNFKLDKIFRAEDYETEIFW